MSMEHFTESEREEFLILDKMVFDHGFDSDLLGDRLILRYIQLSKKTALITQLNELLKPIHSMTNIGKVMNNIWNPKKNTNN